MQCSNSINAALATTARAGRGWLNFGACHLRTPAGGNDFNPLACEGKCYSLSDKTKKWVGCYETQEENILEKQDRKPLNLSPSSPVYVTPQEQVIQYATL